MVALTFVVLGLAVPLDAGAASACGQLDDLRQRADCAARERAREAARAEVDRRVGGDVPAATSGGRSAAWQDAVEEAKGTDLDEILAPRPLAAIVGLVWFGWLVRRRWRGRRQVA